jgi:hypothetical protein
MMRTATNEYDHGYHVCAEKAWKSQFQEEDRTWQLIRVPNTTRRQLNITNSQQNTIGRRRDIMKPAAMRRPHTILKSLEDMDSTQPTTPRRQPNTMLKSTQ